MSRTKVRLTDELSKLIKNTRINNGIKSSDLANHIEKSVAYVSKLESTGLKYIDFNLLKDILEFLTKNTKEDFDDFITKTLEKFHIEKIQEEDWVIRFDLELRQIPIPKELVNFINEKLKELNLTPEELVNIINRNEDLKSENMDFSKYDKNTIIRMTDDTRFVIFDLNSSLVRDILNNKKRTINYITMLEIISNIFKLQGINNKNHIDEIEKFLTGLKFYTLNTRNKLLKEKEKEQELHTILNQYDTENLEHITRIFQSIKVLSAWNVDYANHYLKELSESFNINDVPFIIAAVGRKFYNLRNLDKANKKSFLQELDDLIDKYSKLEYDKTNNFDEY